MDSIPSCSCFNKYFKLLRVLEVGSRRKTYLVERYEEGFEDGNVYALKLSILLSNSRNAGQEALNEVRLLASIRHPHVVQYYEAYMDGEYLCLVMDAMVGGDLASLYGACNTGLYIIYS